LLAAGLMYYLWENQQGQRNQELVQRVRAMALVVEGELSSSIDRLRVLAEDPHLAAGSLEVFHQRLQQLLSLNEDWGNIILLDDKRQLLDAAVPFGTPLPDVRPVSFGPGWIADGRPRTSDLSNARIRGQSTVAIGLPVAREDGQPVQALVVG